MPRSVVLGVDSSTQSTKVLAVDVESGEVVGEGRAPHSGHDIQDPAEWWEALVPATRAAVTPDMRVEAISVGGQQHGLVTLDADGQVVRPAPLWNNVAAAPDAERLNARADFAAEVGTRLVASITIAKLAHLARTAPEDLARTAAVGLPHDWLNLPADRQSGHRPRRGLRLRLVVAAGRTRPARPPGAGRRRSGGASGCGCRSPRPRGAGRDASPPKPRPRLGLRAGIPVGPGTGDNMAAALGHRRRAGRNGHQPRHQRHRLCRQLTSPRPTERRGRRVRRRHRPVPAPGLHAQLHPRRRYGRGHGRSARDDALDRAARCHPAPTACSCCPTSPANAPRICPKRQGPLTGLTAENAQPELLVRAALDGVAAGLAYCVEALARGHRRAGGDARRRRQPAPAWRQAIADATGLPVTVRGGGEHAARGAAMQALAIARGEPIDAVVRTLAPGSSPGSSRGQSIAPPSAWTSGAASSRS